MFILLIEDGMVKDVSFKGEGCAISKASASLMTQILKGKTKEEAEKLFDKFHDLVTGKLGDNPDIDELGKLAVSSRCSGISCKSEMCFACMAHNDECFA